MPTASREQAYPEALSSREDRLVAQRRDRVDSVVDPDGTTGRVPAGGHSSAPADGARLRDDRPRVGLALSGGGIRSATFSLGVLQALARERLIGRIDFLSTVSGGGYVGAFLGCLFQRWRALHAGRSGGRRGDDARRGRPRAARQPARVALPLAPRVRPLPDPQPGQRRNGDARRVPAQLGRRAGRAGRAAAGAAHPLPSRRRTPRTHRLSPSRGRARGRSRGTVARARRRRLLARRSVRAAAGRRRRGGGSPRVSDARRRWPWRPAAAWRSPCSPRRSLSPSSSARTTGSATPTLPSGAATSPRDSPWGCRRRRSSSASAAWTPSAASCTDGWAAARRCSPSRACSPRRGRWRRSCRRSRRAFLPGRRRHGRGSPARSSRSWPRSRSSRSRPRSSTRRCTAWSHPPSPRVSPP